MYLFEYAKCVPPVVCPAMLTFVQYAWDKSPKMFRKTFENKYSDNYGCFDKQNVFGCHFL